MSFPIVSLAPRAPMDGLDRKHGPSSPNPPAGAANPNAGAVAVSHVPVNWSRRQVLAMDQEPRPAITVRPRTAVAVTRPRDLLGAKAAAATERPWARLVADRIRVGSGAQRGQVQQRQQAGQAALPRPPRGRDFLDHLGRAATVVAVVAFSPLIVLGAAVTLVGAVASLAPGVGTWVRNGQRREAQDFVKKTPFAMQEITKAYTGPASTFGKDREAVMAKVVAHAQATGKRMDEAELSRLVAVGEAICDALENPDADPTDLRIGNEQVGFKKMNGPYGAKAVAWYMMAQAAAQDLRRERANPLGLGTSDMVTDGTLVMRDPGHKLFKFLKSGSTTYERTSTHFRAQTAHGLQRWNGPAQWGIEDYADEFPGKGGAMLFDALRNGADGTSTLFVKFEDTGCPDPGLSLFKNFMAARRNVMHAGHFLHTRLASNHAQQAVVRQEHVHKGRLKEPVMVPFKRLVDDAVALGVVSRPAGFLQRLGLVDDTLTQSARAHGLSAVVDIVAAIQAAAVDLVAAEGAEPTGRYGDLLGQCGALQRAIRTEVGRLDAQSGQWGIERRGAEVHVELRPSVHRQRQSDDASPSASRSSSPSGGLTGSEDGSFSVMSIQELQAAERARSAR